jgi:hypothetical protein
MVAGGNKRQFQRPDSGCSEADRGAAPPGSESVSQKVDPDGDKGMERNVDAELVKLRLHDEVKRT